MEIHKLPVFRGLNKTDKVYELVTKQKMIYCGRLHSIYCVFLIYYVSREQRQCSVNWPLLPASFYM